MDSIFKIISVDFERETTMGAQNIRGDCGVDQRHGQQPGAGDHRAMAGLLEHGVQVRIVVPDAAVRRTDTVRECLRLAPLLRSLR